MNKLYRIALVTLLMASCSAFDDSSSSSESAGPTFIDPVISNPVVLNEKEISFGLYPNNVVTDSETINEIEASSLKKESLIKVDDQYYFENNNGKQYESKNGSTIAEGTHYYKMEPITWNILSKTGNQYLLIAKEVIDSHRFNEIYLGERNGVFASNYEHSEIRSWLNNEFKFLAFGDSDIINQSEVDNSLASTMKESNPYVCNNTLDYVFLPSVSDLTNPAYGFDGYEDGYSTDANRTTTKTDFASSRQDFDSTIDGESLFSVASYWTRSPYDKSISIPDKGDYSGATVFSCLEEGRVDVPSSVDDDTFYYSLGGVRPCICITYDFGDFPHHVQLPEQSVSYPTGEITSDELASILRKTTDIEKRYMSRVGFDNIDSLYIERFNDGYYHYHIHEPLFDVYAYSPSDFTHNYHCSTNDGETYSGIADYITPDADDQYSYAFGYGQLGPSPAALIACQSGLIFPSWEFNTYERFCKKTVESYFVKFKCEQVGGSVYFAFEMNINKYGGIDCLKMGVADNPDVNILTQNGYKVTFGNRADAPQFLVNLFANYH